MGRFEIVHGQYKVCTIVCKEGYKLVLGSKQDSQCLKNSQVEAIFYATFTARQAGTYLQEGACPQTPDPQWQIPSSESDHWCVRKDFVQDITK